VSARALRRLVLALALGAAPHLARGADLVVEADLLHTAGPRGSIAGGVVVIRDGRIREVGERGRVAVPEGAAVLRAPVVTPGLVDAQSVVGLSGMANTDAERDVDEATGPTQAGLRAIDGVNPRDPLFDWLLAHGVTAVQTGPGEANPIGGLAGVFKTHGDRVESMTLRFPSALVVSLGERPKATYGEKQQLPMTRMGTAAVIRQAFVEAQAYRKSGGLLGGKKKGGRDLAKEALVLALERKIPVLATARREDDLHTALRLAREFELDLQLADAVEAYLAVDAIREAKVPVLVGPVLERIGSPETINLSLENAAILARAGVPVAFRSGFEDYVPKTHVVLFEAAVAGAYGLGFERALAALTIEAARLLGVADRVGSLEPGKDADLALFDGDPFEYASHVDAVVVNGKVVYRR
jgi:imidazolonepropionase-like amidohydrolase